MADNRDSEASTPPERTASAAGGDPELLRGAMFDALRREVVPGLLDEGGTARSMRAWSVGCETGEDAYSLAMLLCDEAVRRSAAGTHRVFVSGTDERALALAREGVYDADAVRSVSAESLETHFRVEHGRFRVREQVRDMVVFSRHELLTDAPFCHLDLVLCRDVLGSLARDARHEALGLFHYALGAGGMLILATPEAIGDTDLFAPANEDGSVLRKCELSRPLRTPAVSRAFAAHAAPPRGAGFSDYESVHDHAATKYAPPSVLLDGELDILHYSGSAGEYVGVPGGRPTRNLAEFVREPLRSEIQSAALEVKRSRRPWRSAPQLIEARGGQRRVAFEVEAVPGTAEEELLLLVFDDLGAVDPAACDADAATSEAGETARELEATRRRLADVLEDSARDHRAMQAANEELIAKNDHLRSAMEALQTTQEELESLNVELTALNTENRHRAEQCGELFADLQHLIESSAVATLFLDRELRIVRYTPAAGRLFDISECDRGRPLADLEDGLEYADLGADARRVLESLVPAERELRASGDRWYLTRMLPYRAAGGRVDGVVLTLIDITERRRAEEALRASDRRKDEFLAMLAHELRNPLAPICSALELLKISGHDPRTFETVHARLQRQTQQLVRIVDDLMDVSRISRGNLALRTSPVSVADLVRDSISATQPFVERGEHELSVSVPDEPITLHADAARLTQVLSNLINNAAKFTPKRGRIAIEASRDDTHAVISVKDTGIGIPAESQQQIFEIFRQLGADGPSGGIGVGLTLARSLVELHGGDLSVYSAGRGTGSEFTVRLPMPAQRWAPSGSAGVALADAPHAERRVLIVDDNEDAAETLGLLVQSLGGHDVRTAGDGFKALELARAFRPHVALLDLGMPRMDGCELARRVREEPWGREVTLIALTGWGQNADRERTRAAGFDYHLVKPADFAAIEAALERGRRDD